MSNHKNHNRRLQLHTLVAVTLTLLGTASFCGAQTSKPAAAAKGGLTEKDYREFAEKIEQAMADQETDVFVKSISADAMLDRALKGLPGTDTVKEQFRTGFKSTFSKTMAASFASISDYKLLRITTTNGECHALFRALVENGGLNYHLLALAPGPGRRVQVADMHFAIMGEWTSTTIRRIALPLLAESEKSFVDRLVGTESDVIKYRKQWTELFQLSKENKSEKVMAAYQKLPATLQREKFILIHRLKASQEIGDQEYEKTIAFWAQHYPQDVSLPLVSIDGYALKKQHKQLLAVLDRLDASVGGDPYLNVLRAYQHQELKQYDQAREAVGKTIKAEPKLATAYDCALTLAQEQKDFKEVGRVLAEAEKNLGVDLVEMVDESEDYVGFRKTEVYRTWKENRPAKPARSADR